MLKDQLNSQRWRLTAIQKSAAGIVCCARATEGPNKLRAVIVSEAKSNSICRTTSVVPMKVEDESKTSDDIEPKPKTTSSLMAQVLDRDNLTRALKQVKRNKGAPGIDGITVDALSAYLKQYWPRIKMHLALGTYHPKPARRVEIPKPDGRKRKLGIPGVVDRLIQQAIAQVLQSTWDDSFHDHSYGFRPNKSAHQAIRHAQSTIRSGKDWVVDCDIESFFDEVNHDVLMTRLRTKVKDDDLLELIKRYLKAGVWAGGKPVRSTKGVPQGSPLSPVLSNILLNDLDWELERRGYQFARYADDFQIYVGSQEAGERLMTHLQHYLGDVLRLKVQKTKSAVDRPCKRTFLGFGFSRRGCRLKVSDNATEKLKAKVRQLSRRTRGHSMRQIMAELKKSLLGWKAYFGIAEVMSPLRDLDKWVRRKLRCYVWKQWGRSGYRQLRRRGVSRQLAWNTAKSAHGPWRLSASPALARGLPNSYFRDLGLPELCPR